MCGFVTVASSKKDVTNELLESGLESIRHRGPDSESTWLSPGKNVGLGHARLSIIDLSTGTQPIAEVEGQNCIVANGEFYDFEEIRYKLEQQGYKFRTHSDSEIALHLYRHFGTACLEHLRGEFCFSLWDEDTQTLFAARDRFGINPLFYTLQNGKLYLASEIKSLFAMGVEAKWDTDSYFTMGFMLRDRSLFSDIHQLPPGHYLLFKNGELTIRKYWDLDYPAAEDTLRDSEEQIITTTRNLLKDAVKTRLRADVPVGVYLSGGVDSCAALGMASEVKGEPLKTFTLCFDSQDYNEGQIARNMVRHNIEKHDKKVSKNGKSKQREIEARFHEYHTEIPITQNELADNFFSAIWHTETTCANPHIVAKYLLSKQVQSSGIKVVLTGEGADELFAGYSHFRNDILRYHNELVEGDVLEKADSLASKNKVSAGVFSPTGATSMPLMDKFMGMQPTWLLPFLEKQKTLRGLFNEPSQLSSSDMGPFIHLKNALDIRQLQGIEPVSKSQYTISKSILPNYILCNLGDRMEMAHSLEGRLPFMDHLVAEYVTKVPVAMKIKGMTEKYVLREAVKPYITKEVLQRQKHPFLAPPSVIDPSQRFYQLVRDTLSSDLVRDLPFFDHLKISKFVQNSESAPREQWPFVESILMELLSLCAIQHHFKPSA